MLWRRFRRMQGYDVLYPLGFDSLGISAENYATKIGKHPSVVVRELVEKFTKNMVEMGWSIELKSQVATSDPEFIKWTQWMFIQFFNAGLAYKSMLPMNWCPNCRTTLTNEDWKTASAIVVTDRWKFAKKCSGIWRLLNMHNVCWMICRW